MARKFKEGDVVMVNDSCGHGIRIHVGKVGRVVRVHSLENHPYRVIVGKKSMVMCNEHELTMVPASKVNEEA